MYVSQLASEACLYKLQVRLTDALMMLTMRNAGRKLAIC
jgi:hypothetical protein